MKLSGYMLVSLALSLVLHLIIMLILAQMTFPAATVHAHAEETKKRNPLVQTIDVRELAKPTTSLDNAWKKQSQTQYQQDLTEMSQNAVREILQKENLLQPKPAPHLRFAGVDKALLTPKLPNAEPPQLATAPRPKIVAIDFDSLPPARQAARQQELIPKLERIDVPNLHLPSLLPHGPLTAATGATYDVGVKLGPVPKFGVPDGIGDDEQQPAPTSKDLAALLKEGNLPGGLKPQGNSDAWQPGDKGMKKSLSPFDSFVDVKVSIWEDRKAGGGYFKISISPNRESDLLRDIAKDTLIIIDHSASIEVGKLRQFKTASLEALSYLNRRDSFNIVGFNVTSRSLFPGFVPLNDETMANAQNFIRNLFRGGMTDVFGSIAPFVQESNGNPERPLNIFLLTDGQSTVNIYQSDDFIRRVVQMNPGNVSIYPFSAGKDANRELLDFLGYLNRGYNFHAPELKDFKNQLLSYIGEHSSLIIRDLEYMVEGQVGKQIFPRRLPHLYRQETLEILGQYGPQDTELVFTLNGKDADGQVRDLVFRRKYQDCPTATQELPMQWASKKVFHLLAQKTLSEDQQEQARLNREIQALVLKFKLYNPY